MIPDQLKIQPGQKVLTPEQEAYARQFARERLAAMRSTAPYEQQVEAHLRAVYRAAEVKLPTTMRWFDSPLAFVQACVPYYERLRAQLGRHDCSQHCLDDCRLNWGARVHVVVRSSGVDVKVRTAVGGRTLEASVLTNMRADVWASGDADVAASVQGSMGADVWTSVGAIVRDSVWACMRDRMGKHCQRTIVSASVAAFYNARVLALYRLFHEVFAENQLIHLARFNEMVSGYRLGDKEALVVRKPTRLELDAQGRLHSASGPAIQYRDGWGFYAWHGVRVSEQVILDPDHLTREDFLTESNVEVRRVIQERMGHRFVAELGGVVLDRGSRGTLYAVALPQDPERVAHYVQMQDASTPRQYVLRVPPTVQTAAEAVAWTFQVGVEDYHPAQET